MKYMFKRIIVGVAVGLILFYAKSCDVHAATYDYLKNATTFVVDADFDSCIQSGDSSFCTATLSDSWNAKSSHTIYSGSNTLALRKLSFKATWNYNAIATQNYCVLQSTAGARDFIKAGGTSWDYTALYYNNQPSYIKLTTQDNTVCNITNYGVIDAGEGYGNIPRTIEPYFEVPSECNNKYLKEIEFIYNVGYNYNGLTNNIFKNATWDSSANFSTNVSNNKNNSYLYVNTGTLYTSAPSVVLNCNNNYSSSTKYKNTYTISDSEIKESLSDLEKEIMLAQLGGGGSSDTTGPSSPSNEQYDDAEAGFTNIANTTGQALSGASFNDFLTALTQKPILEIQWVANNLDQGETYCPSLYIPFLVDHTNGNSRYGMNLPCMSSIYNTIPYVGGNATSWGFSIITLWHIVLHGYLMYLLVLTWVNLVKYTVTRSSSEIEVIEL